MPDRIIGFSTALEECLIAIGQGVELEACLARYPEFTEKLRQYLEIVLRMRKESAQARMDSVSPLTDIPFEIALNNCIRMIQRGETVESCYARYPEYEERLKPWLTTVVDLRKNGSVGTVTYIPMPTELTVTPPLPFPEALEDCLKALEQGIKPELAIARYPYYAEQLRPWVFYVSELRRHAIFAATQEQALASKRPIHRQGSLAIPRTQFSFPSYQSVAASLFLAAVLFFGGTGLARAASDAIPGETLYPVKLTVENLQLLVADDQLEAQLKEQFASRRLVETAELIDSGQEEQVVLEGKVNFVSENQVTISDVTFDLDDLGIQDIAGLRLGAKVKVTAVTNKRGIVVKKVESVPSTTSAGVAVVLPSSTARPPTAVPSTATSVPPPTQLPTAVVVIVVPTSTSKPPEEPTSVPTIPPTATSIPTLVPSATPDPTNTAVPTSTPEPTTAPTNTSVPTVVPTNTAAPTIEPTAVPTDIPEPTAIPTDPPPIINGDLDQDPNVLPDP